MVRDPGDRDTTRQQHRAPLEWTFRGAALSRGYNRKNLLLGGRRRREGSEVRADLFLLRMVGRDRCPGRRGQQVRLGNKGGFTWQPPGARRMVTLHLSQRGLGALLRKLGGRHQALNYSQEVASPSRQAGKGVAHCPTYPPTTRGRPEGAASRNFPLI